jgi:hypothetical protein
MKIIIAIIKKNKIDKVVPGFYPWFAMELDNEE